jgi:hypothetical protein
MIVEMIQKMIIYALSSLELSCKYFSTSPPWYFDFATSNHMANNVKTLTNVDKYFGNLKIYTIDDSSLPITIIVMFLLL